ncbi:TPA: hypothetical protein P0E12_004973 [Vibrio harveyi]|nr:hypothetical protein [Vibrio harveyi]
MEHYQHLILKGLINGGGSSSETYVYRLLTGDFSNCTTSVSHMWGYLDKPLQNIIKEILSDVCDYSLEFSSDQATVNALIKYMSNKSGRKEFFKVNDRAAIERMSDDEYEQGIKKLIDSKRAEMLERE